MRVERHVINRIRRLHIMVSNRGCDKIGNARRRLCNHLGFGSKITVGGATVDVPMLVLRGEWLQAIGLSIGSTALLSTDQRGEITLCRLGVTVPRWLRIVRAKP
jgi:hypothetical protein